jgi:Leucine Rich repeat
VQRWCATERFFAVSLAAFALLIFGAIGCEDPKATQDELDAMSAIQRVHGHLLTDAEGHATSVDFSREPELRDQDLAPLSKLTYVERVKFDDTPIGDGGLVHLEGLKHLRELSLRGTKVTDEGLVHLQKLPSLTELDLERLPITNDGLAALGPIKSLRKVYVGPGGPTTTAGADALTAQNPRVHVSKK